MFLFTSSILLLFTYFGHVFVVFADVDGVPRPLFVILIHFLYGSVLLQLIARCSSLVTAVFMVLTETANFPPPFV